MKRFTTTAVAVTVFVALAAYVYFAERGPSRRERADEAKKPSVLVIDGDNISSLELKFMSNSIKMEKSEERWRLIEPVEARTANYAVETIVEALRELKSEGIAGNMADAAAFGLDNPQLTITAFMDSGGMAAILVGDTAPVGGNVYVANAAKDAVYLVSGQTIDTFRKTVNELRDRSVTDALEREEIESIAVSVGSASAVCMKRDLKTENTEKSAEDAKQTEWHIEGRLDRDCSEEANALMAALEFSEALDFVEVGNMDSCGLDAPRYLFEIRVAGGKTRKFEVGAPGEDKSCLKNIERGEIYVIEKRLIERLEALRMSAARI